MRSPNIRYLPAVDHVRAFAALLIVFYHGLHVFAYAQRFHRPFDIDHWLQPSNPLLAALAEGHTAVALFMVLSGFILTWGALGSELDGRGFLRNRLLRTYPLFLLLLFAGAAAVPGDFHWTGFVQSALGFANLPGALVAPPFTSMLWTIAVEWQFYVLFPLLLAVLKREGAWVLVGMVAVMLVMRAFAVAGGGNARDIAYLSIVGRLDQFLSGMVAAAWFRRHSLPPLQAALVAALALVVMVVALAAFNAQGGWPTSPAWKILWPTFEGVVWAAFIVGYVDFATSATHAVGRMLGSIGVVSYSIYLVHFLVIDTMVRHQWLLPSSGHPGVDALLNTLLLALPATLALASLGYRFVERPFLGLRGRYLHDPSDGSDAPDSAAVRVPELWNGRRGRAEPPV